MIEAFYRNCEQNSPEEISDEHATRRDFIRSATAVLLIGSSGGCAMTQSQKKKEAEGPSLELVSHKWSQEVCCPEPVCVSPGKYEVTYKFDVDYKDNKRPSKFDYDRRRHIIRSLIADINQNWAPANGYKNEFLKISIRNSVQQTDADETIYLTIEERPGVKTT
ncbi:MAG: hypothetical protein ABIA92_04000 [Patescibacteria group bacterium]